MSLQHLLPASHAGQRIARTVLVTTTIAVIVAATLSVTLTNLALP